MDRHKVGSDRTELEKEKYHITVEIIEYMPNKVMRKAIMKKPTGSITAVAVDAGEKISERITAFDIYVQIIEGTAEISIDRKKYHLKSGGYIVIPAHSLCGFSANEKFKMIKTVIKSGYED